MDVLGSTRESCYFTLATTTALIFGEQVSSIGDDVHDTFARSFDYASMISAIRLRLADLEWAYKPKAFSEACDTVKKYASHFVNKALENQSSEESQPKTESQALIRDLYEELKDPKLVRDQLVHVLIAGRDTTACLMSWTLCVLRLVLSRHTALTFVSTVFCWSGIPKS